jgi:hypothetical protein
MQKKRPASVNLKILNQDKSLEDELAQYHLLYKALGARQEEYSSEYTQLNDYPSTFSPARAVSRYNTSEIFEDLQPAQNFPRIAMVRDVAVGCPRKANKEATFDLLNRTHSYLQRFFNIIRLSYYRYEVTLGLYVLTYGEKSL